MYDTHRSNTVGDDLKLLDPESRFGLAGNV
jgi:hypothetical protein